MKEALLCQPETEQGGTKLSPLPPLPGRPGVPRAFCEGGQVVLRQFIFTLELQAAPLPSIQAPLFALGAGGLE